MPIDPGTLTEAFERAVTTTNQNMLAVLVVLVILMVLSFTGVAWLFFRNQGSSTKSSGSAITALAETLTDTARAQREAAASQQALATAQAAMVEQLGAMVSAVRANTEADVQRMGELRDSFERMEALGEREVDLLNMLRADFQGVSGLGGKIDAMHKAVEAMKAQVDELLAREGDAVFKPVLDRIDAQFTVLTHEMAETREDIRQALELMAQATAAKAAEVRADGNVQ